MMRISLMALAVLSLVLAAGCSKGSSSVGCSDDASCSFGTVCIGGSCQVLDCNGNGDCLNGNQACLDLGGESGKVCAAPVECGCVLCALCPIGEVCSLGQCLDPTACADPPCVGDACTVKEDCGADQECVDGACTAIPTVCSVEAPCPGEEVCVDGVCQVVGAECSATAPCPDGQVCDSGECRLCVGEECGPTPGDCTVDGCEAGHTCNEETKLCEESTVTPPLAGACEACTDAASCGDYWKCAPLTSGLACLPPCASHNDCPSGWACKSSACEPQHLHCNGCVATGCADGEACNMSSGECQAALAPCATCVDDSECGTDAACITFPEGDLCAPRCAGGASCIQGSVCELEPTSQLEICMFQSATCCYDTDPTACQVIPGVCDPECAGDTPHCLDGTCVQCKDASHCGPDLACHPDTHTCVPPSEECSGDKPYYDVSSGLCVQCLVNADCAVGNCNTTTHTCVGDVCATCDQDYPACAEIAGEFYCVQCTDDSYCAGGTCKLETFTCVGGFIPPEDACESTADCDPGITNYTLACDTTSGVCYDMSGGCDDITAFCKGGGKCLNIMEQFMGEGLGIPEMPGMEGTGTALPGGACACTPDGPLGFTSSECPEGTLCMGMASLFELLGAGGTGIGGKVCTAFDLSAFGL